MTEKRAYFYSTRDLLIMAALASMGGIASTYINALGDAVQSVLGFAGTTQWAAGLHVLWLILAVGIVQKPGTGTITGILKGVVELLTGNTHGLLVLLVDFVAGILVDLGLLPFGRSRNVIAYAFAGGLAAASNVFVFQLFASLPADLLAYGALILVGLVAFLSGVVFSGVLGWMLLNALQKAGVIKLTQGNDTPRSVYGVFLAGAVIIAGLLTVYLRGELKGPLSVSIAGAVEAPYQFPGEHGDIKIIQAKASLRGAEATYEGYPVLELIQPAKPKNEEGWILVQGADGYSFFIDMQEVNHNKSLLLIPQGQGNEQSYNLVGAASSKAWVRGVVALLVVSPPKLEISGLLEQPGLYVPEDWQFEMDSANLTIGDISGKYQGAALGPILELMGVQAQAKEVLLESEQDSTVLNLQDIQQDDSIRIFTIIQGERVSYAVASMDGEIYLAELKRILVR